MNTLLEGIFIQEGGNSEVITSGGRRRRRGKGTRRRGRGRGRRTRSHRY
jgi:hypothetical protein